MTPPYLSYENYTFKVQDGQFPFTWEISNGNLPDGLSLITDEDNYNSYLYGTPTKAGDFTFTFGARGMSSSAGDTADAGRFIVRDY